MAILLLLLAISFGWASTLAWLWWKTRFPSVSKRVLINYADDTAVRGVLVGITGDWLVLAQAELLGHPGEPPKLDGQTFVPRSRVLFMQVLP